MANKRFVLVAYDSPNDRRRTRLHKRLLDFGSPVQYSVFECLVDGAELQKLEKMILRTVKTRQDQVRIYQLCADCRRKTWVNGNPESPAEQAAIIV